MSKDPTQLPPEQLSKLDDLSAAAREKPMEASFIGAIKHAVTSGFHAVTHFIQTTAVQTMTQDVAQTAADALDTTGGGEEEGGGEDAERLKAIGAKIDKTDDLSLDELVRIRNEHTP